MESIPDPTKSSKLAKASHESHKSSAHVDGDSSGSRVGNSPDPRWPYLNRWRATAASKDSTSPAEKSSPKLTTPPSSSPSASSGSPPISPAKADSESLTAANGHRSDRTSLGKGVCPPASSELHSSAAVSTLDGDTSPYKGRRSFTSTPPPSRLAKAAKGVIVAEASASTHVPAPAKSIEPTSSSEKMADVLSTGMSHGENLEVAYPKPSAMSVGEQEASHALQSHLGAWSKPLHFGPSSLPNRSIGFGEEISAHLSSAEQWPSLSKQEIAMTTKTNVKPTQIHHRKEDDSRFPWAARMNPISRNLYRACEPEYLEDGTPKVTIPNHVLLHGLENQKEYILGQFFRCSPPPGGLVFAVFNKLWGRNCKITIRKLGDSKYLFHIPNERTRTWVLQRGLWHVDDCLMFVAAWNPTATLAIPEIKTIPVWVTLKNIPNLLYSIPGISNIASGLGAPMATYKPLLDPILMDEAKILVEVELSKAFPPRVAASDETGFISMVDVEYAWIPTTCSRCGQLGHKIKYCLKSDSEEDKVPSSASPMFVPTYASQATAPDQAKSDEVTLSETLVSPTNATTSGDLIISAAKPVLEEAPLDLVPPTMETNQPVLHSVSPITTDTVHPESMQSDLSLGNNKFASLVSSGGEEDSSDMMDLMTPPGKRILRDRPVKPSVKAQESTWHVKGGGRGKKGRGRGGSG